MSARLPSSDELTKLPPDGGPDYNRLVFEKSPYLLQHATNPVDWYPWGDEAFALAEAHDKPVFLSVGYSTCHWCHVMEQESFEDPAVAELLNEHFVNIKVDREERPDIDNVYMSACQMMTGGGGWPMTVVMTPARKPFFAGTYFPKEARFGRPGMLEMLPEIGRVWREQREEVLASADKVVSHMEATFAQPDEPKSGSREPGIEAMHGGYRQLASRFDAEKGGFGPAPKFPTPHNLSFLLRYAARTGEPHAADMVEQTLRAMRAGGVYDHIGYGFHRYSTDADWLVPHFEKMLYDQAMLTIAYVEAYQATGCDEYARTARETIEYVLRDMTSPEGGFYSAEDADSEGEEGKFYVWRHEEVVRVLSESEADRFCEVYNIRPGGNFENPHTPPEANIPHLTKPISEWAREYGVDEAALRSELDAATQRLFEARRQRIHPHKDDKILTDWNGLMIAALAKSGQALNEPSHIAAAQRAADFILSTLRDSEGHLLKRYRDGKAGLPAHLDDYAFLVWGLLDLYEASFEPRYLQAAISINDEMLDRFWDDAAGGLFFTADDAEPLPVRTKTAYDGAIPSGNSVAMSNLLRLSRILASAGMDKKAAMVMRTFAESVSQAPSAHTALLCSLDFAIGPSREVIILGRPRAEDTERLLRVLRREFVPNKIVLFCPSDVETPAIAGIVPSVAEHKGEGNTATAFVCADHACHPPVTSEQELLSLLSKTVNAETNGTQKAQ